MQVEVTGDFENALRLFKKLVSTNGILKEIKLREASPNRGERRKEKAREAQRRRQKRERKWGG